jgi:hypothetical protein
MSDYYYWPQICRSHSAKGGVQTDKVRPARQPMLAGRNAAWDMFSVSFHRLGSLMLLSSAMDGHAKERKIVLSGYLATAVAALQLSARARHGRNNIAQQWVRTQHVHLGS